MDSFNRIANLNHSNEINKIIDNCKKQGCANGDNCPYYPDSKYYQPGAPTCVFSHDPKFPYVPSERQKRLHEEKKNKSPGPYDHLLVVDDNSNK